MIDFLKVLLAHQHLTQLVGRLRMSMIQKAIPIRGTTLIQVILVIAQVRVVARRCATSPCCFRLTLIALPLHPPLDLIAVLRTMATGQQVAVTLPITQLDG